MLQASRNRHHSALNTLNKTTPFLSISHSNHGGVTPYDKTNKLAKQLVNAAPQFISLSLQPIRDVDELSFRNLLSTADPQFALPYQTYFTTKVIPDLYSSVHGQIESQLASIDYCTIIMVYMVSSPPSHYHDLQSKIIILTNESNIMFVTL